MEYRDELENLGVNVTEGIDRVVGDEELYEMMLGMFVDMVNESPIKLEDFDQDDTEELAKQVHVLKGMTGNLSLTPLFDGYVEILGMLRTGRPKEARVVMERIMPVQSKIMECIVSHR